MVERLTLRGFQATAAFSGTDALRLVEADPPEVVVLDLMMPGDGAEWRSSSEFARRHRTSRSFSLPVTGPRRK